MNKAEKQVRELIARHGMVDAGAMVRSMNATRPSAIGAERVALINSQAFLDTIVVHGDVTIGDIRSREAVYPQTYATEFPDYPAADMPSMPAGFADTSWHNDICPSFTNEARGLVIWVDYAAADKREISDRPRFIVTRNDDTADTVLETDDWAAVVALCEEESL